MVMQDVQTAAEAQALELRAKEQVTKTIVQIVGQEVETQDRSVVEWLPIKKEMMRVNQLSQWRNLQMQTRRLRVLLRTKKCVFREHLPILGAPPHARGMSTGSCIIHTVLGVVIVCAEEVVPATTRSGQLKTESFPRAGFQR